MHMYLTVNQEQPTGPSGAQHFGNLRPHYLQTELHFSKSVNFDEKMGDMVLPASTGTPQASASSSMPTWCFLEQPRMMLPCDEPCSLHIDI